MRVFLNTEHREDVLQRDVPVGGFYDWLSMGLGDQSNGMHNARSHHKLNEAYHGIDCNEKRKAACRISDGLGPLIDRQCRTVWMETPASRRDYCIEILH